MVIGRRARHDWVGQLLGREDIQTIHICAAKFYVLHRLHPNRIRLD